MVMQRHAAMLTKGHCCTKHLLPISNAAKTVARGELSTGFGNAGSPQCLANQAEQGAASEDAAICIPSKPLLTHVSQRSAKTAQKRICSAWHFRFKQRCESGPEGHKVSKSWPWPKLRA
eukprot:s192_g2.t1